ncbi:MAG: hypothetical protein M0R03_19905 [Novosphingobium sp.]|nr:hypothetical protein [Novosphingobium sp.]
MKEIKIKESLYKSIVSYCKENDIIDIDNFCNGLLQNEFNIERFGIKPGVFNTTTEIKEEKTEDVKEEKPKPKKKKKKKTTTKKESNNKNVIKVVETKPIEPIVNNNDATNVDINIEEEKIIEKPIVRKKIRVLK